MSDKSDKSIELKPITAGPSDGTRNVTVGSKDFDKFTAAPVVDGNDGNKVRTAHVSPDGTKYFVARQS